MEHCDERLNNCPQASLIETGLLVLAVLVLWRSPVLFVYGRINDIGRSECVTVCHVQANSIR